MTKFVDFLRGEDGTTAVEYAVMLALVLAAVIGAIGIFGAQTGGMYGNIQASLAAAGFGS